MEIATAIASGLALVVAIASVIISTIALRKSSMYQSFEYAARLELESEQKAIAAQVGDRTYIAVPGSDAKGSRTLPSPAEDNVLSYRAKLVNRGHKTVYINEVSLECGSRDQPEKRMKYHVLGDCYLSHNAKQEIHKVITGENIRAVRDRFGVGACMFVLRVDYTSVEGDRLTMRRMLGGVTNGGIINSVSKGAALS